MEIDKIVNCLVKFGKKEDIEKLFRGTLYAKRLKYYRDYEDKARGDNNEGVHVLNDVTFKFISNETGEVLLRGNGEGRIIDRDLEKKPVFCSCCITMKDLELKEEKDNEYVYKLDFNKILGQSFEESYWDTAIIIEPGYFFDSIKTACKKERIALTGKKVSYYNSKINLCELEKEIEKDFDSIAFWKDNAYINQKEHRILFENIELESNNDGFILDIGSLEGHSKVLSKDDLKNLILDVVLKAKQNS